MFAEGSIALSNRPNVLSLPITAVRTANGASYVYVLNNGTVEKRTVTTGERASEKIDAPIEITSGLSTGDRVVGMDLGTIKPNLKVELINDTGSANAPEAVTNSTAADKTKDAAPKSGWMAKIKALFTK